MFEITFFMVGINVAGAVVPAQYFDNFLIFFSRGLIVVLLPWEEKG